MSGKLSRSAALAVVVLGLSGATAHAAIRIHLEYDVAQTELAPDPGVVTAHHAEDLVLSGHQLYAIGEWKGSTQSSIRLGGQAVHHGDFGGQSDETVHVGNNTVTYVSQGPSSIRTTRITTDGVHACKASRTMVLKPGKASYITNRMSDRAPITISAMRWTNMICTITAGQI